MKIFIAITLFLATAAAQPSDQRLAVTEYGIKETIAKAAKAVAESAAHAIDVVDRKADDAIDSIEDAAKTGANAANNAVDSAFDILKNLIIKAEENLLPTKGCIKGKLEEISDKKSTFGTDMLQCVLDGSSEVRQIKTDGISTIRDINNNFKEFLQETCDGWWDCGKLIVKFTAEEAVAIGKCNAMIVSTGAKLVYVGTKAVACVGGVAASYTGQSTGIIKEVGKCITDLFTKYDKQYLLY